MLIVVAEFLELSLRKLVPDFAPDFVSDFVPDFLPDCADFDRVCEVRPIE